MPEAELDTGAVRLAAMKALERVDSAVHALQKCATAGELPAALGELAEAAGSAATLTADLVMRRPELVEDASRRAWTIFNGGW